MKIHPVDLDGVAVVECEPFEDSRGLFARFFCEKALRPLLGDRHIVNVNFSRTVKKGAIRGLHFQRQPHAEVKLVRCLRGAAFDVCVDVRRGSPTFLRWFGVELTSENIKMIHVPEGFAHGFQTLEENTELLYLHTAFYAPQSEGGVRFDSPAIGIPWPLECAECSERDRHLIDASAFGGIEL